MGKSLNDIELESYISKDCKNETLDLLWLCQTIQEGHCTDTDRLLDLCSGTEAIRKQELRKLPFHLNLLESFVTGNLKETAHSRFLWSLLRIPEVMESFMSHFFGEAAVSAGGYKVNYPDRYRIDISVEGDEDFFIIENKINNAEEQCGQIYRYVQRGLKMGYRKDNIHVLYINSQTHDSPSDYSLSKDGKGICLIPEEVPLHVISYKDEIVEWLETVYSGIKDEETYLKSALFQYIDYLKEKFNTSNRFNDMNSRISSMLNDRLFNPDMSTFEKLDVLSDTMKQLDALKSDLESMREKEIAHRFQEWFDELVQQYPLKDYAWMRDNEHDIHIDFIYHGYKMAACLTIDNGLCWGIRCVNKPLPKKYSAELHSEVQLYLPKVQNEEWWPVWNFTSYANGLDRFLTLMKCVERLEVFYSLDNH